MKPTILTKSQKKVYGPKVYTENGTKYHITAKVRHDDECGNRHNTFSITGAIYRADGALWKEDSFGCVHEQIAQHFPELAPFIKFHGMTTDSPLHYIANTVYHALEHGPTHAWVYYTGYQDPSKIGARKERLIEYVNARIAREAEGKQGYRVEWDEKTIQVRNLDHARSSAVWPEATDEELTSPGLEMRLEARLPQLMSDFQDAVESLGFTY